MLIVNRDIKIPLSEIQITAVRSQGPGGQNVNKVNTAIHLRFDILESTLLEGYKERILAYSDKRISDKGVIVIKAQNHRTQERNKQEAFDRLQLLLQKALNRSLNVGLAGYGAMTFQVCSMMWLRTTMNYQFKNGF